MAMPGMSAFQVNDGNPCDIRSLLQAKLQDWVVQLLFYALLLPELACCSWLQAAWTETHEFPLKPSMLPPVSTITQHKKLNIHLLHGRDKAALDPALGQQQYAAKQFRIRRANIEPLLHRGIPANKLPD